jgi:pyroglutamyl-peptidase
MNVLLTGFGPFPGAPVNPTGPLVRRLAQGRRRPGERRTAHVFCTSYEAVDRDLPFLLAQQQTDVLVMFGLAARTPHLRVETWARNVVSRMVPDVTGNVPIQSLIAAGARAMLPMCVPSQQLVRAVRQTGVNAVPSRNAGSYLCNYLCWRSTEAAARPGGPRVAAFVHVPRIGSPHGPHPLTFDNLVRAGEALLCAAVAAARGSYHSRPIRR